MRHCIFSTGTFVEPIEVWDPPSLLRFRVTEQPEPLREWSPYHIHPAHLDHYLHSHKGQFLLEALPDGRTRLTGTTSYSNRMWPAAYWNLWSDYIIHRIHGRVLTHIQKLAEASEARNASGPDKGNQPIRLRILSYNIHHGEGVDRKLDLERIARVIQSVEPDIVSLQEVDRKVARTKEVDQPAELARLTGMHVVFGGNIPLPGGDYHESICFAMLFLDIPRKITLGPSLV